MNIPPIILYDKEESLLEILKALAAKESALAAYANAESDKIKALITRLQECRSPAMVPGEIKEIGRSVTSAIQHTYHMQKILQSHLKKVLEGMDVETVYDLFPLPSGSSCTITARGQGKVTNIQDFFYLGLSYLQNVQLSVKSGIAEGYLKYKVKTNDIVQGLEAAMDGVRIDFVRPMPARPRPDRPNIVLITGYAVTKKQHNDELIRGIAWFALTLWDYGQRKNNKFRMLIFAGENSTLNHDSGIIT